MDDSKIEKINERRIDLLYKNLEHMSCAYFAVESVFPVWEAAFALIVGQIIVTYFNPNICIYQQMQLAIIGLIISLIWFILVSLNFQNASHMDGKIRYLHDCLHKELKYDYYSYISVHDFIKPWSDGDDKEKWTLWKMFLGLSEDDEKFNIKKALKSTWFFRRLLPFILCIIWLWLWIGYPLPVFILFIVTYVVLCDNLEDKYGRVYSFEDI